MKTFYEVIILYKDGSSQVVRFEKAKRSSEYVQLISKHDPQLKEIEIVRTVNLFHTFQRIKKVKITSFSPSNFNKSIEGDKDFNKENQNENNAQFECYL